MGTLEWLIVVAITIGILLLIGLALYVISVSRSLSHTQSEMRGWAKRSQELSAQARTQVGHVSELIDRAKSIPEVLRDLKELKKATSELNQSTKDTLGEIQKRNTMLDDLIGNSKNLQDALTQNLQRLDRLIVTGNQLSESINNLIVKSVSLRGEIKRATQRLQEENESLQKLSKEAREEFERYQRRAFEIASVATIIWIICGVELIVRSHTSTIEAFVISLFTASFVTFLVQIPQLSLSAGRIWWEGLPNWLTRILGWPIRVVVYFTKIFMLAWRPLQWLGRKISDLRNR